MENLIQWNARSVRSKQTELIYLINKYNPSILAISETWLGQGSRYRVPGFNIIRGDRRDGYGGVALLIKKNYLFRSITLPVYNNEHMDIVAAQVAGTTYVSVYVSEKDTSVIPILKSIIDNLQSPVVILGDFNGHHSSWGAPRDDSFGISVADLLDDLNLGVLNDGSPTRRPIPGQARSYVDLSISSPCLMSLITWNILNLTYGSDHYPIILSFPKSNSCTQALPPLQKFRLPKDKWEDFSASLNSKMSHFQVVSEDNIIDSYNNLTSNILMSAEESFPLKNVARNKIPSPPWWDEECTEIVKKRNDAELLVHDFVDLATFNHFKNHEAAAKRLLRKKKRKGWKSFCESISPNTPLSSVWRSIRRFRTSLKAASVSAFSLDWVPLFFSSLAVDFVPSSNQIPFTYSSLNTGYLNEPFSMQELLFVLKRVSDSTPGDDGIPYSFIVNSNESTKTFYLNIINVIVATGKIPPAWKHHLIIPLLKPNKDPLLASSYRPVALASTLCKLTEHLIKNRLEWHLEHNQLLSVSQFGFRKGKSVTDNHSLLTTDVLVAFSKNETVTAAFLDVSSAYDNVDLIILKQKLLAINFPLKFVNFIFNLFIGRSISIRLAGVSDSRRTVWKGVPQGSVLSPLLYDVYTRDLDEAITGCNILQYADDLLVYSSHKCIDQATNTLQSDLDGIQQWMANNNLALSPTKCSFLIFSRKRVVPEVNILINQVVIPKVDEVMFLGKKFDSKLNGIAHVNHLVQKCEKSISVLRALSGVWWGAHPSSQRLVYNALIRSILDFGSFLLPPANKGALRKLDLIQSKSLRIVVGAMKSTPINALQIECCDPPLELRRQFLSDNYIFKTGQIINHPLLAKIEQLKSFIDSNNSYWARKSVPHIYNSYTKLLDYKQHLKTFPCHPLFYWPYEAVIYTPTIYLSIGVQKESVVANSLVLGFINSNYQNSEIFYTDASKTPLTSGGEGVGAAFLHKNTGFFKLFKYDNIMSNYTAEALAILECVNYIISKDFQESIVFTDSLSCLNSLLSNPFNKNSFSPLSLEIKSRLLVCSNRSLKVSLAWIPGHSGIQGNEAVDKLAKLAASQGKFDEKSVYSQDILASARSALSQNWRDLWSNPSKGKHYKILQPDIPSRPWFSKIVLDKRISSTISRLRFGHCCSPAHLTRLSILNDSACECGLGLGDIDHILFICSKYQSLSLYSILISLKASLPVNTSCILTLSNNLYIKSLCIYLKHHNISL